MKSFFTIFLKSNNYSFDWLVENRDSCFVQDNYLFILKTKSRLSAIWI